MNMVELKIDKFTFEQDALDPIQKKVEEFTNAKMNEIISLIEKKYEFPKFMNKTQAARYMNVSYNTMMNKYVPSGLKLTIIEGVIRISQSECDRFMEQHQK